MKRVVAVNGSPRKGMTQGRLEEIRALLADHDIEVEIISLRGKKINDCAGCERCVRQTGVCVQKDDAPEILERLQAADGFILASPVYVMNVTGKLKSLIDKTASWVHRPPLTGKPGLVVVTTAGSGLKETLAYLEEVVVQWGAQPGGQIGRKITEPQPVSPDEVARFVGYVQQGPGSFRPNLRQVIMFQVQKVLALKISTIDRAYWTEQGWLDQPYYVPCRLSWPKRLVGWLVYRILMWRMQPVGQY